VSKRSVTQVIRGTPTSDGAGVRLTRVIGGPVLADLDPFLLLDEFGSDSPDDYIAGFPDHPHRGFETVTYMLDGRMRHQDNQGNSGLLGPGSIQWMTAGRGIVHSERAGDDLDRVSSLDGIQSWMALPNDAEEIDPDFLHYPADVIPEVTIKGVVVRVIMGNAFGERSVVKQYSPTLYLECQFAGQDELQLPDDYEELALYVVDGRVQVGGNSYDEGTMAVACGGHQIRVHAETSSRVMVIGGSSLGERHIWWNFVSSSKSRIEDAKADWSNMRLGTVQGDDEFIPLPE